MLDTFQASILDLPNLITDQPTALHIATQLSQRVGRYWLAPGRAQIFKALGGVLHFKPISLRRLRAVFSSVVAAASATMWKRKVARSLTMRAARRMSFSIS